LHVFARPARIDSRGSMKRERITRAAFTISIFLISIPVWAHHGASEYDMTKIVTLDGKVTELQFVNPHSLLTFTVKEDSGKVTPWQGELPSPNLLTRRG
jgi:hypothetical protein